MCTLSTAEARRVIINAQFPLEENPLGVLKHTRVIPFDALSRVDKSHRLSCFARLDGLRIQDVDSQLWPADRVVSFETYTHAACILPIEDWPLFSISDIKIHYVKTAHILRNWMQY